MGATKFTPGPWRISGVSMDDGSISVAHDEHRIVIATVTNAASFGDFVLAAARGKRDFGSPDTAKTQWANARLIAAAPDMYAALDECQRALAMLVSEDSVRSTTSAQAYATAVAAEAKARAALSRATA